jgi:hypothetical protein
MSSGSLLEPINENHISMAPPATGSRRTLGYEMTDRNSEGPGTGTFAAAAQSQGHRSFKDTMNLLDTPLPPRRELPFTARPGSAPQQQPVTVSSNSSDMFTIPHESSSRNETRAPGKRPLTSSSLDLQAPTLKPKAAHRSQSMAVPASQRRVSSTPEFNQTSTSFDITSCGTSAATDHRPPISDVSNSIKLSFNNLRGFAELSTNGKQNMEEEIIRTICEMPDDFISLCELIERALGVQLKLKHILNGRDVTTD